MSVLFAGFVAHVDNRSMYTPPPSQTDRHYKSENADDLSDRYQNHMSESKHSRERSQPQSTQHINEPNSGMDCNT